MKKILLTLVAIALFAGNVLGQEAPATCTACNTCSVGVNQLTAGEKEAGFEHLFDGTVLCSNLWQGSIEGYPVKDGTFFCDKGGNLLTVKEYDNFIFRFEFKLPPKGNNGVGIRAKVGVDAAFGAMEIQILGEDYEGAKDWQKHGSIYGVVPAKTGALKPTGEWNTEEIIAIGPKIKVIVNGIVIVDADITDAKPVDGKEHPGLKNTSGHIGFLGHNDPVEFRNVRVKKIICEQCVKKIAEIEEKCAK